MAAGVINLQKESGGIVKISPVDGTGVTELVVPESGELVSSTGNQSIDGIKTFIKSPIVPTPTTGTQAVNKDYADLKVALASFIGTNQSLTGSGYQKLPGGLIIQWGTSASGPGNVTFPIAFPTSCFGIYTGLNTTVASQPSKAHTPTILNKTTTGFTLGYTDIGSPYHTGYSWVAVGY